MNRKGFAQIPLMIGLLLMAIAVPVATKLVQTNQENRGQAAATATTAPKVCVEGMLDWCTYRYKNCSTEYRCTQAPVATNKPVATSKPVVATNKPVATSVPATCNSTVCNASCNPAGGSAYHYVGTCTSSGCICTTVAPTATSKPVATSTPKPSCTSISGQYCSQSGVSCNNLGDPSGSGTCSNGGSCCKPAVATATPKPSCTSISGQYCTNSGVTCNNLGDPSGSGTCINGGSCCKPLVPTATPTVRKCVLGIDLFCLPGSCINGVCVAPTATPKPACITNGSRCVSGAANSSGCGNCCNGNYSLDGTTYCGVKPTTIPTITVKPTATPKPAVCTDVSGQSCIYVSNLSCSGISNSLISGTGTCLGNLTCCKSTTTTDTCTKVPGQFCSYPSCQTAGADSGTGSCNSTATFCCKAKPTTKPTPTIISGNVTVKPTSALTCDSSKYNMDGYNEAEDVWTHFVDEYTARCICGGTAYRYVCEYGFWACGDGDKTVRTCEPTTPPEGACTPLSETATLNQYSIWRSEYVEGSYGTENRSNWNADFDCNGTVTLNDYSIWRPIYIKSLGL